MNLREELLQKTSRTFALSIPLLPDELQRSVGVAYLLFRIADTIEDELPCSFEDRRRALLRIADSFAETPHSMCESLDSMSFDPDSLSNDGYADLLQSAEDLVKDYLSLSTAEQAAIASHLSRTCRGMAHYLGRDLSKGTTQDLREYCYIVAGIVGEMLTELFMLHDSDLSLRREQLLSEATAFGEGLQLVNIIRDAADDVHAGRFYLPLSLDRPKLIELAQNSLTKALNYIQILHKGNCHPGIVQFNALNLALAFATIEAIREQGTGAKLTRAEVENILNQVTSDDFLSKSLELS